MQRRRFEQTTSLQERIADWVEGVRVEAAALPPGRAREEILKKIRQAKTAMHLEEWANSPDLQPPK